MPPGQYLFSTASSTASVDSLLSLDTIRAVLQRLEDTIIFQLIERVQFAHNANMYAPGVFPELKEKEGWEGSWTQWFLKETESAHAKARRWSAPDEYPFTSLSLLPQPILPPASYPNVLFPQNRGAHTINVNDSIYSFYTKDVLPAITDESDDGQYGSAAVRDVEVLSALSRRIHYGMFVCESKFRAEPSSFVAPILSRDTAKLEALITKPAVEAALLERLRAKAEVYGKDMDLTARLMAGGQSGAPAADEGKRKISTVEVVRLYEKHVIPLTKDVEVDYLLKRLEGLSEETVKKLGEQGSSYAEVLGGKEEATTDYVGQRLL